MCKQKNTFDFTIITVCFNAALTIQQTITSVLNQKNISFEYIIIDGVSNDGTIELVRNIHDDRLVFISEPDNGLYDAMNKGIMMAKGRYIAILNADDIYTSSHVLSDVLNCFTENNSDLVSGNLFYFKDNIDNIIRKYPCCDMNLKKEWENGKQPPHPSTFVKNNVYKKIGTYITNFKISSDYEFLFRAIYVNGYKHSIINKDLVAMRVGGESTSGFKSMYIGNKEVFLSWKRNGLKPPLRLIPLKLINKLIIK
ncbi:glycosyltransferase [Providencia vermicola]|uniref:glycosyltransferase family 2 protein n=1 Tax=Providencia vermicola TaxID=333965 RepID=UPI00214F8D61|nr:glycosyltransferase family 2 protein [Providencia vermicola]MCR4181031.1 glycosyltransferase [Providencia vermicola]